MRIHNPSQNLLQFEIEDTRPGIAPDELDQLFEAFVQTSTSKQTSEGTSLSLVISRKFIQLMGGDITVNSKVGQGTTFQSQLLAYFENTTDRNDLEMIESLINEISLHHQALANSLAELAELFDYDTILKIRQAQGLQS